MEKGGLVTTKCVKLDVINMSLEFDTPRVLGIVHANTND